MSRQQDAEHHIQYAEDRIDEACTQTDRETLLECVHDEMKAAQDHGRAKSDLDAQMAMALWAKIMTISGIASSVVAGGGLYLVWRTLKATGDAVDAANATNKIMNDQAAGYIVIESVEMQTQAMGIVLKATVKNIGARTVRRVSLKGRIRFMWDGVDGAGHPTFQSALAETTMFMGAVAPHQTAYGVDIVMPGQLVVDHETYMSVIFDNKTADFDCKVEWDDIDDPVKSERHILVTSTDRDLFRGGESEVVKLRVSYSGLPKDWEDKAASGQ